MIYVDIDGGDGIPVRIVLGIKTEEQGLCFQLNSVFKSHSTLFQFLRYYTFAGHNIEIAINTIIALLPQPMRERKVDERLVRSESYLRGPRRLRNVSFVGNNEIESPPASPQLQARVPPDDMHGSPLQ